MNDFVEFDAPNKELRKTWRSYSGRIPNILNHGMLTPDTLIHAIRTYRGLGKEDLALFLDSNGMSQLLGNAEFSKWLDPVSQLEVIKTGSLGMLLGIVLFTDSHLPPEFQFIDGIQLKYRG
jgi:hypothetical protein